MNTYKYEIDIKDSEQRVDCALQLYCDLYHECFPDWEDQSGKPSSESLYMELEQAEILLANERVKFLKIKLDNILIELSDSVNNDSWNCTKSHKTKLLELKYNQCKIEYDVACKEFNRLYK